MTTLRLEDLSIGFEPRPLSGVSGRASGRRIALLGDWGAVTALCCGFTEPLRGDVYLDDVPARRAVLDGVLGVVDPGLSAPRGYTLREWLSVELRLCGYGKRDAEHATEQLLTRLGIAHLGRYDTSTLAPDGAYVASIALGVARQPKVLLAPAPHVPSSSVGGASSAGPSSFAFQRGVLERAVEQCELLIQCEPTTQPELFFSCDQALALGSRDATTLIPAELWSQGGRSYRLIALSNAASLADWLARAGAEVRRLGGSSQHDASELWVSLPSAENSHLLIRAAFETEAALSRMQPLFDAPDPETIK